MKASKKSGVIKRIKSVSKGQGQFVQILAEGPQRKQKSYNKPSDKETEK